MKKKMNITEIFMAKGGKGNKGFDRCFHGTIRRETDEDNNPVVFGKIKVKKGYIFAKAKDQNELGDKLDELVIMILDKGLHENKPITQKISEQPFYMN